MTGEQIVEYERLVDELKVEIAKNPDPVQESTTLDLRDDEPYMRLMDEHLGKTILMLEGWAEG